MSLLRPVALAAVVTCLGCSSAPPPDLARKIERRVRDYYNVRPDVKITVSPFRPSEFPDYETVTIGFDSGAMKQSYDFMLSADRKTLIRMTKLSLVDNASDSSSMEAVRKEIDVKHRPVRGNRNAKVVLVAYNDFQCHFCSRMHQTLFPELLNEYGDRVAFVYKDFPLSEIHLWAMHAAVDANCLAAQNEAAYWDLADQIHAKQPEINARKSREDQFAALDRLAVIEGQKYGISLAKLQSCLREQKNNVIADSVKEGEALGVAGTPTLFVNGQMVRGARSIADLRAILNRALEKAGAPVPALSAAVPQNAAPPAAR
jgi:protein-disulfide isomerase